VRTKAHSGTSQVHHANNESVSSIGSGAKKHNLELSVCSSTDNENVSSIGSGAIETHWDLVILLVPGSNLSLGGKIDNWL